MKKRYTVYLSKPLANRFDAISKVPGTKSALIEQALDRQLDPGRIQKHDEALLRRMDGLVKGLGDVQRDVAIVTETLSLYVRYFLTVTPPVPKTEQDAARALGRERFEVFVAQIGRRLASDHRLFSEVLESVVANNPDLLADAIDDGPLRPRQEHAEADRYTATPPTGNAQTQREDTHHA
ncbi:CopG family transcriptional regulator [Hyphomicrobium sp. CS1BSMeth3]|uniref:CopG family transcriptional regulator n=1 Tax=Hyphomicrobium sp. CS1BSMeth3 TaxID=1892844 RepID=UPI0011603A95|nr:CopG family transcriptional regulator [Hyphomicrobium sp. CS1BSMeth3]